MQQPFRSLSILPPREWLGSVTLASLSGLLLLLASATQIKAQAPSWSATSSLNTARSGHTATLLENGKVLVVGGADGVTSLSSAELYDPATGVWRPTGSLSTARGAHIAVR